MITIFVPTANSWDKFREALWQVVGGAPVSSTSQSGGGYHPDGQNRIELLRTHSSVMWTTMASFFDHIRGWG